MKKGFLRFVARSILVMLLLAQWSIVAHACTLTGSRFQAGTGSTVQADQAEAARETLRSEESAPTDCASMDGMAAYTQDALCAEHCGYGDQGDRSAASTVPPVVLSVAYFVDIVPAACPPRRTATEMAHALALGSPPHAILHCVRRS
ncbi:MAG: hypothetical protein KIT63_05405 [Rhodoferax sp.]|nr:hypothetical protein [Rhodoferax sp.]